MSTALSDLSLNLSDLPGQFLILLVALARLAPIVWLTPFFGGRSVPAIAKTALILVLGLLLYPLLLPQATELARVAPITFMLVAVKEVLLGFAIGFLLALVFWAAQSAGWLIDSARGASLSEVLLPQAGGQTSPVGLLLFLLTIVLFFALGGQRIFFAAMVRSYQVLPLLSFPRVAGIHGFALLAARLTAELWLLALSLAAPVIGALLLAELTLGWINRFVPQVNVFFLAMPLRALLGIAVLVLAIGLVATALPQALDLAISQVAAGLELLSS